MFQQLCMLGKGRVTRPGIRPATQNLKCGRIGHCDPAAGLERMNRWAGSVSHMHIHFSIDRNPTCEQTLRWNNPLIAFAWLHLDTKSPFSEQNITRFLLIIHSISIVTATFTIMCQSCHPLRANSQRNCHCEGLSMGTARFIVSAIQLVAIKISLCVWALPNCKKAKSIYAQLDHVLCV